MESPWFLGSPSMCPGQHLGRAWRLGRVTFEASIGSRNRCLLCFLNGEIFSTKLYFAQIFLQDLVFHQEESQLQILLTILRRICIYITITWWWFQSFLIFTLTLGDDPIWLIFFNWVETTNWISIHWDNPIPMLVNAYECPFYYLHEMWNRDVRWNLPFYESGEMWWTPI